MSFWSRLPQVTLIVALAAFTLTLILTITSGAGLSQPLNLVLVICLAATVLLLFLAQSPNNENAALMLWASAGVWGAAAYVNFQMLGILDLLVALLCAASAFWIERESRAFSFAGPALLIGIGASLAILSIVLTR